MLERNRLQPPLSSAPLPSSLGFEEDAPTIGSLFASAEDYDSTGILSGVDPCESRYWWMPDLYAVPTTSRRSGSDAATQPVAESTGIAIRGLLGRLLRSGQATRRTGSRNTAAA